MMKKFLTLLLMSTCMCLYAQKSQESLVNKEASKKEVVSYTENDQDGETIPLADTKSHRIIDINSKLEIKIDKKLATLKIADSSSYLPKELRKTIESLTKVLESRNDVLDEIQGIVASYNYEEFKADPSGAAFEKYVKNLRNAARKLDDILNSNPKILNKYLNDFAQNADDTYSGVYKATEAVLNETLEEVEKYTDQKGIYIQFGGWVVQKGVPKREIPIPGFDSIKPLPPFEVDRWQVMPTPKQLADLEQMKKYAEDNKGKEEEILKGIAEQQLKQLQGFITTNLLDEYQKVLAEVDLIKTNAGDSIGSTLQTVINEVDKFKSSFNVFVDEVNKRKSYYTGLTSGSTSLNIAQIINQVQNDVNYIKTTGQSLIDQIKIATNAITSSGLSTLNNLKTLVSQLNMVLKDAFESVRSSVVKDLQFLLNGKEVDFAALKFSDRVFKLSLSKLPTQSELDLINTGSRKEGDQLAFKFVIQNKDGVIYEEKRSFYMYQVLVHLEGTVGVIFADPLANTAVQTQFQLAPYYNVLAKGLFDKGARRRSVTYNRLLDWGIGLHVSAPDFDGDDIPELGAGVVLSFFADYVQSGAAINVFTGDPYWFFGIRLPVPSFNIGSVQSTSSN